MIIGTRVLYPEEVGYWNAEIVQISVFNGMKNNLNNMRDCARAFREAGIRYVIHPVMYSLIKDELSDDLKEMARFSDVAMILHDERTPDGNRLEGEYEARFKNALDELKSITPISFENATNTGDVHWFWNNYADSITLDIGHIESFGLDSIIFVKSLDESFINKIQFVHMHRNNGPHGGITDHWPLNHNCREVKALEELLKRKSDVSVILELNEVDQIGESLELLAEIRDKILM
jgi:sugar phosphate isomerase/epimerase